ncbi:MAG: glucose 1-dehydrogenase [Phenylobacterium sp.]|nr:glucose 1-dehydrogenase [Phenylobacterium sp.]
MSGRVDGKVALVTGAASGIGRACAERLAAEGARVVLTDLTDETGAALAAEINSRGAQATYLHQDVTDEDQWVQVIADVRQAFGRLDILVNNAGIGLGGSVLDMSLADFRKQMAVNVEGVFLGVKHSLPLMRESGEGGSIINMSSVAGLKGAASLAGYCASKGAVRLFTKAVALECAGAGDKVRVNSVHPGIIETPIWDTIIGTGGPGANAGPQRAASLDAMASVATPLGFKGDPSDIADAVLWLASSESRYVTGAELVIDGGLSVR